MRVRTTAESDQPFCPNNAQISAWKGSTLVSNGGYQSYFQLCSGSFLVSLVCMRGLTAPAGIHPKNYAEQLKHYNKQETRQKHLAKIIQAQVRTHALPTPARVADFYNRTLAVQLTDRQQKVDASKVMRKRKQKSYNEHRSLVKVRNRLDVYVCVRMKQLSISANRPGNQCASAA